MSSSSSVHPASIADAPLSVCFVSETWQPEINGVTHTLSELADQLVAHRYRLSLVRPRPCDASSDPRMDAELLVKPVSVLDYDGVQMGAVRPSRLKQFWQQQRPDVIYIATEGPLGMVALKVARALNIPVVSGFHTNFDFYSQHYILLRLVRPFIRTFLRRFHNRTAITLVPTHEQAASMTRRGYDNVQVMGRGLDTAHFSPTFRSEALRAQWGANPDDCVILHVGRLAVEKNVETLASALTRLHEENPDQIAVIVGDGPLRKEMEETVPWAHFAGFRRGDELARYYASADVFVFPSLSETFGNVVTEAMASGLATVAYDYAAAHELIDNHHTGVTVPCEHKAEFEKAVMALVSDTGKAREQGAKASHKVASLGWDNIALAFMTYLHQARENRDA